ncbi:MAG: glycosyltransferase [bacterium]
MTPPGFADPVPGDGYVWWYLDVLDPATGQALVAIFLLGNVFSPRYARARRRGVADPLDFCAVNVALYGPVSAWAMTEHPPTQVERTPEVLRLGASSLSWDGPTLVARLDERTAPLPGRIVGEVRLTPQAPFHVHHTLDAEGLHRWWPRAPVATAEVHLTRPAVSFSGLAYHDMNQGAGPLERSFRAWDWARASDGHHTEITYDVERLDGSVGQYAVRFGADGQAQARHPAVVTPLPRGRWGVAGRCRADAPVAQRARLEDTPFYTRSWLEGPRGTACTSPSAWRASIGGGCGSCCPSACGVASDGSDRPPLLGPRRGRHLRRRHRAPGAPPPTGARPAPHAAGPPLRWRRAWPAGPAVSIRAAQVQGPLRVGLSVADAEDAALPALHAAAAALTADGIATTVRVVDPGDAPNRKAAQLQVWLADADAHEALVCVDSDVDLSGFPLDSLVAPLHDPACGATWAPPAEHGGETPGDRASVAFLGASLHAFTLLATLDPAGLVGKVFAVRARAMRVAGGFDGLEACLGEDMEIARRLRVAGYATAACFAPVRAWPTGRSRAAVARRFARWLGVIRAQRPGLLLTYPLLFSATTLLVPLGLLAGGPAGLAASGVALTARLAVAVAGRRFNGLPGGLGKALRDVVEGERLTWSAWLRALASRDVEWRGRRLRIGPGGRLEVVQSGGRA